MVAVPRQMKSCPFFNINYVFHLCGCSHLLDFFDLPVSVPDLAHTQLNRLTLIFHSSTISNAMHLDHHLMLTCESKTAPAVNFIDTEVNNVMQIFNPMTGNTMDMAQTNIGNEHLF